MLSGVNRGSNLGEDLALSGTIGACLQAWEQGVPGIALSQVLANFTDKHTNWRSSTAHLETFLQHMLPLLIDNPTVLNVNFPPLDDPQALAGSKVAEIGRRLLPLMVKSEIDASGQQWFDYRSLRNKTKRSKDSDIDLAYRGFITLTPLTLEMADYTRFATLTQTLNL